uniref:DUF4219 domain-containing protein n=1 Tax=Strigamia maritima TaxID=126957 RepID=T1IL21_STRMM
MANAMHIHHRQQFKKLEGISNYNNWKFAMQMQLIRGGLWIYVDGTLTDATKELQVLATIALGVQEHVYQEVRGHTTAKAAWDNLAKIYQNKSFGSQVALLTTYKCAVC